LSDAPTKTSHDRLPIKVVADGAEGVSATTGLVL
jgi:hypothetical protein